MANITRLRGLENIVQDESLQRLITALLISGTERPMTRLKVMPVENIHELFTTWQEKETLSVKHLRMKVITNVYENRILFLHNHKI